MAPGARISVRRKRLKESHFLLGVRKAFTKGSTREQQARVLDDRLRLRRQIYLVVLQPPENGCNRRIHQRELIRQEVRFDLEEIRALQNGIAQDFLVADSVLLVRIALDLVHEPVPVALDAIERE